MERRQFTLAEISGPKNAMGYPEAPVKSTANGNPSEIKSKKIVRKPSR